MSVENPIRVLFAEDEMPLRLMGELTLSVLPRLALTSVEDGDRAIEELKNNQGWHILITDKDMPGQDGLAVARLAKQLNSNIRTVLVTASDLAQVKERDTERNIDHSLQKPYSPAKLVDLVSELIQQIDASN